MSAIEWTDITINPFHLVKQGGKNGGHWCRKVSPGCANCYAEEFNRKPFFGFASQLPYTGSNPGGWIFNEKILASIARRKSHKRIFVGSMTDIFGEWIPDAWLAQAFEWMSAIQHHAFQILTKRPQRMLDLFEDQKPSPNIWLGASIEDQARQEERSPILANLHEKGWRTFYSVEPLLEKVILDLDRYPVNWVIIGGESGSRVKARPCNTEWMESVVVKCQKSTIPVFVKQLGTNPYTGDKPIKLKHGKGGNFGEFPPSLSVREFPEGM